jgi:hypothetical protein
MNMDDVARLNLRIDNARERCGKIPELPSQGNANKPYARTHIGAILLAVPKQCDHGCLEPKVTQRSHQVEADRACPGAGREKAGYDV